MRVVAYNLEPWGSSMGAHRLVAPLRASGIDLIRGNQGRDTDPRAVDDADLVIIARDFPRLVRSHREIVDRTRRLGKPLVYETDDLLIALPNDHPDSVTGYFDDAVLSILEAIVDADAVTVTTRPLARALCTLNSRVHVLPNYLIDDLWMPPLHGGRHTAPARDRSPLIIGYMGGGSHQPDLESISESLVKILLEYGDHVVLKIIGLPPPASLGALRNVQQLSLPPRLSPVDYAGFTSWFREQPFDILLGPLRDSLFNRCKSPIKFLEYAMTGAASLFSRVTPYAEVIDDGRTGLLASSPEEFGTQLRRLIENGPLREKLALAALEHVSANARLSAHANQWRDVYSRILHRGHRPKSCRSRMRADLIAAVAGRALRYQEKLQGEKAEGERHLRQIKNSRAWRFTAMLGQLRFWK